MTDGARQNKSESSTSLLKRAQAGQDDAVEQLCERYSERLRRWAHGRLPPWARDGVDTEDIVQDTLLQAFRRLPAIEVRHRNTAAVYLHQAVRNKIRDQLRRVARRPPGASIPSQLPNEDPSPLECAIGAENVELYEEALSRLRPEDREAIFLRMELGGTYAELAEVLGKPTASAARLAVSRALLRLVDEMSREPRRS
jgi:RNA polymerase sigma-70 factor (ECF subfamily)